MVHLLQMMDSGQVLLDRGREEGREAFLSPTEGDG